jgi:hypothetical protein
VPLLVKYVDDGTDYVPAYEFHRLLSTGKIKCFLRSGSEWVNPKVDPIRGQGDPKSYTGPNRRARWL